jgi:hypothetical protein
MTTFPDESFLALVPVQTVAAGPGEGKTLVLIRPKILSPRWAWLLRMMKRPNYRVRLDARGTAVWQACDGTRTVAQVAEAVAGLHPGEADTRSRTARFVLELARGGFVRLAR